MSQFCVGYIFPAPVGIRDRVGGVLKKKKKKKKMNRDQRIGDNSFKLIKTKIYDRKNKDRERERETKPD